MKKLLLLPLFALGAMTVSHAQTQTSGPAAPTTSGGQVNSTGPVMTFEVLEYNFGTIKQGDIVHYEFKFKNTGKEPLIINSANGSCGCTVPDYPKEPIKPNGDGVIKVTFNSTGKMGQQDKTVTLMYDTDKQVVLHLKGNVEAPNAAPAGGTATPAPAGGTGAQPAGGNTATPVSPAKSPAPKQPAPAAAPAPAPKKD